MKILSIILFICMSTNSYARSNDIYHAINWYKKAAANGNADAQVSLGNIYDFGDGVKEDNPEAVKWYLKSAKNGSALGQYFLGFMYRYGEGTKKNLAEAFQWYQKSALQGDANAQFSLGSMYYYGEGRKENHTKAFQWYRKSALQGDADAQYALGGMYQYGDGIKKNRAQAIIWYQKSALQNNADAQYALGNLYKDASIAKTVTNRTVNNKNKGRNFVIQAGVFSSNKNAVAAMKKIKPDRRKPYRVKNKNNNLYHVYLGKFASADAANKAKLKLERLNRNAKFMVKEIKTR